MFFIHIPDRCKTVCRLLGYKPYWLRRCAAKNKPPPAVLTAGGGFDFTPEDALFQLHARLPRIANFFADNEILVV